MKILIIGGAGFLGSHIKTAAEAAGHYCATLDLKLSASIIAEKTKLDADTIQCYDRVIDVSGRLGTVELFQDIVGAAESNIINTLKLLEACEECGVHYTYVTLGNKWLNPYSITKNCAAEFVRMYDRVLKLPTQVAVTFNCYGPRQRWEHVRKIVPEFMTRAIAGKPLEVNGNGFQWVDLVYAPDFAMALVQAVANGERGTIQYGTAKPLTVLQVAEMCISAVGSKSKIALHPARVGEIGGGDTYAEYPMEHLTPTEEALKITADWYKENYKP